MDADILLMIFYMCLAGTAMGTFSGLIPGIHVNTLAVLLLASEDVLLDLISPIVPDGYGRLMLACCVVSAATVHSAVDFIPSAFIGVPDADNVLSVLPAHRLLLDGHGMLAVRCAAVGSLVGAGVSLILAVPMYFLMSSGFGEYLNTITIGVLIIVMALMILDEAPGGRKAALAIMALSAAAGTVTMLGIIPMESMTDIEPQTMFPLLTGLFGIPSLLFGGKNGSIPPQDDDKGIPVSPIPAVKGVITGSITGWFPGITSTAGATIAGHVFGQEDVRGFISMVSSIGTASTMFTFVTLCVSGKERSGTMSVVNELLSGTDLSVGSEAFAAVMVAMAISSVLAYYVMIGSGRFMCSAAEHIDTAALNRIILAAMVLMAAVFTGYWGIVAMLACTVIGMLPLILGTHRIHLTGCLIVPVLLFKTGIL